MRGTVSAHGRPWRCASERPYSLESSSALSLRRGVSVDSSDGSAPVSHGDRGHDVFTCFDVLIQDHLRELSPEACYQVARTVLKHLTGIGALETREPITALHRWHQRNRSPVGAGTLTSTLERAFRDTVRTFGSDPTLWGAGPAAQSTALQGKV